MLQSLLIVTMMKEDEVIGSTHRGVLRTVAITYTISTSQPHICTCEVHRRGQSERPIARVEGDKVGM